MLKVAFNTLNNKCPLFKLEKYNITCFLDTGANIPVWNGSTDYFVNKFKDCNPTKTIYHTSIGGFGIGEVEMPVYKLSNFELTDGKQKLVFRELYVAVEENRNRNFDLLITYSMFKGIGIVIKPNKANREISFATQQKSIFNTRLIADGNKLKYVESFLQEISTNIL